MKKKILLGITGSIAAYKTPELVRKFKERDYDIKVVLTSCGKAFVTPLTLQAVSQHPVYEALVDVEAEMNMNHITLARWPDYILIAPATAQIIAKLAHGFADDLLSTLCLATDKRLIIAPAMNQAMWSNQITQANVCTLKERGYLFLGPAEGSQACGEFGLGRMLEPLEIVDTVSKMWVRPYLKDQKVLITAGPTQEPIDPVRYLSNRSSGKMGFALAQAAVDAGADVTLISGPVTLFPPGKLKFIAVKTAEEMLTAVKKEISGQAIFISTAAVADYHIVNPVLQKIKKTNELLTLKLKPTIDILASVSQMNLQPRPLFVGFSAETEYTLKFSEEKRKNKNIDLMVVNDVSQKHIGFDSDKNEVTVLSKDKPIHLTCATKQIIAQQLLKIVASRMQSESINVSF
ncbi:bifunctional phosphopantothenoylcysteine decarboxylase/phosphopantothenate--cysteine ligase CoaBC [Rickettsiella grylli]|nr:bifunctional phosphopantothenoylcysteine decarboxylase/phosphopantothenate--cysteine ligase CoaBC [Rickettsiella grylli]